MASLMAIRRAGSQTLSFFFKVRPLPHSPSRFTYLQRNNNNNNNIHNLFPFITKSSVSTSAVPNNDDQYNLTATTPTNTVDLRKSMDNETHTAMLRIMKQLTDQGKHKNMVYSPLSIKVVLSLLAAAGSESKSCYLMQLLSFLKPKSDSWSSYPSLSFSNGLWVDESSWVMKPCFEKLMDRTSTCKASMNYQFDFESDADNARTEVNSWAEEKTSELIKQFLPPGSVNIITSLILANSLHFDGHWEQEFDSVTKDYVFHLSNGKAVEAKFMTTSIEKHHYISVFEGFKVLRLFYNRDGLDRRSFSMCLFLPESKHGLPALVERVCSEPGFVKRHLPKKRVKVDQLLIPEVKLSSDSFEAKEEVVNSISAAGLFTLPEGITCELADQGSEGEGLHVSKLLHKSFIEVNRDGTKAAAVTMTEACDVTRKESKIDFVVANDIKAQVDFVADHPFLFVINEEITGTELSIGQVLNPSRHNPYMDICN